MGMNISGHDDLYKEIHGQDMWGCTHINTCSHRSLEFQPSPLVMYSILLVIITAVRFPYYSGGGPQISRRTKAGRLKGEWKPYAFVTTMCTDVPTYHLITDILVYSRQTRRLKLVRISASEAQIVSLRLFLSYPPFPSFIKPQIITGFWD